MRTMPYANKSHVRINSKTQLVIEGNKSDVVSSNNTCSHLLKRLSKNKQPTPTMNRSSFKANILKKVSDQKANRIKQIIQRWKTDNVPIESREEQTACIANDVEVKLMDEHSPNILVTGDEISQNLFEIPSFCADLSNNDENKPVNLKGLLSEEKNDKDIDQFSQLRQFCSGVFTGNLVSPETANYSPQNSENGVDILFDNENACFAPFENGGSQNRYSDGSSKMLDFSKLVSNSNNKFNSPEEEKSSQRSIALIEEDDHKKTYFSNLDKYTLHEESSTSRKSTHKRKYKKPKHVDDDNDYSEYERLKEKLFYNSNSLRNVATSGSCMDREDSLSMKCDSVSSFLNSNNQHKSLLNSIVGQSCPIKQQELQPKKNIYLQKTRSSGLFLHRNSAQLEKSSNSLKRSLAEFSNHSNMFTSRSRSGFDDNSNDCSTFPQTNPSKSVSTKNSMNLLYNLKNLQK